MEAFLSFFETMPLWQKLLWALICLSFSGLLENWIPLFKLEGSRWQHARVNLSFLMLLLMVNGIFGLAAVSICQWTHINEVGLLFYLQLPVWVELLIAFAILDLVTQYWAHMLLHKVPWLWKLHQIHHSDTQVDVTTGTRLHPLDYMFREFLVLGVLAVTGMPLSIYALYRVATLFFTYFTHANIQLPLWLDRGLSIVFITPNLHKFHHHDQLPWTDTNYGNIFSIWDRLFGTRVYDDTQKINYGLDILDPSNSNQFLFQLKLPFSR